MAKAKVKGTKHADVFTPISDTGEDYMIQGRQGFDLATLKLDFATITLKTQGNGNIVTVKDASGDTYRFQHVEMIKFDANTPGLGDDVYYNTSLATTMRPDATVHISGHKPSPPGTVHNGLGNDASNYVVVHNAAEGLELGLQVKLRGGAAYDPVSVDADGTVNFQVAAGAGAPANWGTPAKWSFDFSIITGLNGQTGDTLGDFTFKLLVDTDVTAATNYRVWTMGPEAVLHPSNQTGYGWRDQGGTLVIADDRGSNKIAQNSQNYGFGSINPFIDADPLTAGPQAYAPTFGPGEFNIRLEAYVGATLVASNSVDVIVA